MCEDALMRWSCHDESRSTASSVTVDKFPAETSLSPSYYRRSSAKSQSFPVSMKLFDSHRSPRSMILRLMYAKEIVLVCLG
jgi:hypothetical protein